MPKDVPTSRPGEVPPAATTEEKAPVILRGLLRVFRLRLVYSGDDLLNPPVVFTPPPRVIYQPPVVYAPPHVVIGPRPLYVDPRPVYVAPRPAYVTPRWTPPGHRHGYYRSTYPRGHDGDRY